MPERCRWHGRVRRTGVPWETANKALAFRPSQPFVFSPQPAPTPTAIRTQTALSPRSTLGYVTTRRGEGVYGTRVLVSGSLSRARLIHDVDPEIRSGSHAVCNSEPGPVHMLASTAPVSYACVHRSPSHVACTVSYAYIQLLLLCGWTTSRVTLPDCRERVQTPDVRRRSVTDHSSFVPRAV